MAEFALDPRTTIGHVHLKVSDLERAERFYVDLLGFHVTARYGSDAVFLSASDYHHDIGLNTWQSKGGRPPPPGTTGLFTSRSGFRRAGTWPRSSCTCTTPASVCPAPPTTS
jgi:catechol-2,3-dioxygenase